MLRSSSPWYAFLFSSKVRDILKQLCSKELKKKKKILHQEIQVRGYNKGTMYTKEFKYGKEKLLLVISPINVYIYDTNLPTPTINIFKIYMYKRI